jgi:hypothetical protein
MSVTPFLPHDFITWSPNWLGGKVVTSSVVTSSPHHVITFSQRKRPDSNAVRPFLFRVESCLAH